MVSPTELAVLAFAAYRGTQLLVHDSILDAPRSWVFAWHARKDPASPFRSAAVTLISCIYCAGFWVSGAVLAAWLYASGQWHDDPLLIHGGTWLAVAGAQALLNRWDDSRKDATA